MTTSRQLWDRLWRFLEPDKRYMAIGFACAAAVSGLSLLLGLVVKRLIDAMLHHNHAQLNIFCLGVVALYAVRWLFVYGQTVYFAEAGQRLGLSLRNKIYEHLQGLSLGYFNRQRTGGLMSTINNDVPLLQNTIAGLKDVATAPFTIIGGLAIIFSVSVPLSLAAILMVPIMGYSIGRLTRMIRQITRHTQDKLGDVNTLMEETLSGIRVIQSFGAETYEIERFRLENQAAKDLSMMGTRQAAQLKPTIDVIGAAGVAFALWVGGQQIVDERLTLGSLVLFISTLNQIAVSISSLGSAKVTWEQVRGASGRIMENVLDVESDVCNAPNAVALSSVEGRVEFRNVAFSYNDHTTVLRDVSFTMEPGEVVAVVGPSGAGKSTIADLIPRFYDPQAGNILIGDHDLRDVTLETLRRQIGIVPQETMLFGGTIRDNIAYGNPSATMHLVEDAARAANIHDEIVAMHDGYQTVVGERGKQLSGGQRQRIAIARALLKDPRILILDEATSSLDAKSEVLVQAALDKLMQGRTTLVIAHRLSTVQNAHKILVLEAGRIVEWGTHSALIQQGGLYAHLYAQYQREDQAPTAAISG